MIAARRVGTRERERNAAECLRYVPTDAAPTSAGDVS